MKNCLFLFRPIIVLGTEDVASQTNKAELKQANNKALWLNGKKLDFETIDRQLFGKTFKISSIFANIYSK